MTVNLSTCEVVLEGGRERSGAERERERERERDERPITYGNKLLELKCASSTNTRNIVGDPMFVFSNDIGDVDAKRVVRPTNI
jgi:hypothetical protein